MYQYFILESNKSLKSEKSALLALFSDFLTIDSTYIEQNKILIIFQNILESSLEEMVQSINQEFFIEVRLYESDRLNTISDLEKDIKKVSKILNNIPFDNHITYLNSVDLLYYQTTKPLDINLKKQILKKYYNDKEMKNILKVFFETNQNTSETSKKLYMHRNTLIQKLDRFFEETGFNPRKFKDAILIYKAIEK